MATRGGGGLAVPSLALSHNLIHRRVIRRCKATTTTESPILSAHSDEKQ